MYIVSMSGEILAEFDRWDVRSVAKAERWILDHQMVIYRCSTLITGAYVVTVRSEGWKSKHGQLEVCTK